MLTVQEIDKLFAVLRKMKEEGHSIIIITHKLNEVMDISDRIYVLDFGKLIAQGTPAEIQNNQRVIDAYLGVVEDE